MTHKPKQTAEEINFWAISQVRMRALEAGVKAEQLGNVEDFNLAQSLSAEAGRIILEQLEVRREQAR